MDGKNGFLWREAVSCVAEGGGTYGLRVRAYGAAGYVGSYRVRITEMRPPKAADRKRVEAEAAIGEGRRLNEQANQSSPDALKHFGAAARLWHELGDKYWEAVALTNSGW